MTKTGWVLVLAGSVACSSGSGSHGQSQGGNGGGGSDAGSNPTSSNAFVGQWTCPYETNSGFMDSTKMVFTENPDGTLSSTSKIQNDDCALKWAVSGSTATAVSPATCGGFTVTSYTFKLEQGIAFAVATAVEHGTTTAPDGGTAPVDIAGSFGGFCTKDGTADAGTPTVCEQDPVVGCGANGVGYLCLGAASPQSMNPAIMCPQLFIGGSSCCTLGPAASTCHPDSAVACSTAGRSGYTCTGTDTPAQAASVVCESGKAQGDGTTTYCCGTYSSPSCALTGGCGDYTFSCTGTAHPWDSDRTLRCGPANPSFDGSTNVYCCSVRDPAAPNTCSADSTVACGSTMGYSCTGTDAPSDDDPSLVCGTPTAYLGKSLYCCLKQ